jgi:outer membrane protein assembly factor BamB
VLNDLRRLSGAGGARHGAGQVDDAAAGPGQVRGLALAADGKIYLINHAGEAAVIDAATGEVRHTVTMDEPGPGEVVRASIVAAQGNLFLRTTRHLYCIGPQTR